jgi:phytanoyl-CoA hydroxylase
VTAAAPPDLYCSDHVAPMVATLAAVGDAELALFHEQGYLAIRQAFDTGAVDDALTAVTELIDGANPAFRGVSFEPGTGPSEGLSLDERRLRVRKLMSFVDHDERLRLLSTDPSLLHVVSRLMHGDTPELFQDMALLKPPGGREKPWHQDMAYFNVPIDTVVIGVWIALDEATSANGALHVLPGSHRQGPRLHFKRRDWQICDSEVPHGTDVVVPLPPGGVLLWHGLTHHGSPDNESNRRRRALQFHYRPSTVALTTTPERMQHYGGEVRGAVC